MDLLSIKCSQLQDNPDILLWEVSGALDAGSIDKIIEEFDAVAKLRQNFLITEMSNVSFVSASALGQLMECRKVLVEKGGDLVIAGVRLDIKTRLNLMGATKIFRFYNEMRAAINAYNWDVERKAEKIWLSFPPGLQFVPPVRQMVNRITRQKGYSQRDAFRIETIIDEVCNNAVEHGSTGINKNIDLNISIDRDKIEIEVINASDPAKLESLKELSKMIGKTPERKIDDKRGRGLALIKMLSNDFSINCTNEGTSVHVTKLREE